jgi:hypothetical protein
LKKGDKITLVMNSIDKPFSDYLTALQIETTPKNPLFSGPPANIPSNISNGAIGVFATYSVSIGQAIVIKDKNESIAARDEAAKLVAGIEKREAIVAEKESAIKATQEGLAFADVGLKNLRKSLDEREDALNKLQEKLNKAQANLEKLLAENEVKAADLASLSKEAEATKKQYADKLAALSKLEA